MGFSDISLAGMFLLWREPLKLYSNWLEVLLVEFLSLIPPYASAFLICVLALAAGKETIFWRPTPPYFFCKLCGLLSVPLLTTIT